MPDINFDSCPNADFTFTSGVTVGTAISPPIQITALNAPGAVTMTALAVSYESGGIEFEHCAPCSGSESLFGVTITVSGGTVTISGTPTQAGVSINFMLRATSGGSNCDRTYRLPLVREPLDLALVLDRSGSMAWGYNGGFSPPAGQRRWDGLLTGVGALQAQLEFLALVSGDALGMRLFAGSVVTPAAPFNGGLVNMQANLEQLVPVLNPLSPSGGTAMGNGMLAARDLLLPGTSGSRKAMIVFSDGQQNAGDLVKAAAPNQFTHTASNQKLSGPGNEISIYTVCLANNGPHADLMQGIAAQNGGAALITSTGDASAFNSFFALQLPNILAGSSPQYVDVLRASFPVSAEPIVSATSEAVIQPAHVHTFPVNRGVGALVLTLFAPTEYEAHFSSLSKDGVELIEFAEQTHGPGFTSIGIRHPFDDGGTTLDGDWTVQVRLGTRPRTPVPFTLMVLVDDHVVSPSYSAGDVRFKVGDLLTPTVSLRQAGKPIKNAQVRAHVARPGDDVDDLIALANVGFDIDPNDPSSPDVAKLASLLEDPAFLEKVDADNLLVDLSYDSSTDAYTGAFNGLELAGIYQVLYRIVADDPVLGRIQRFHQQSVYVRFPDVDLENSQVTLGTNANGATVLTFLPQTSQGRRIGSGWGPAISLNAPDATISDVVDHGDGRYTLTIAGTLTGTGTLSISDAPVFQGDLRNLGCYGRDLDLFDRLRCWLIKLGLPAWVIWLLLALLLVLLWLFLRGRS